MIRVIASLPVFAGRWACERALDALLGPEDPWEFALVTDEPFLPLSEDDIDELLADFERHYGA